MKKAYFFGGGTISHVRNHFALCAPAYGSTASLLHSLWLEKISQARPHEGRLEREAILVQTRMADTYSVIETNQDVSDCLDKLIADPETKVIFFSCAMCDFDGQIGDETSGKYATRLKTREFTSLPQMHLTKSPKIISRIRDKKTGRKDIFLVGFKTTCGFSEDEMYISGLGLMKESSCNLVLVNDTKTRLNMIITPEEARYHVTANRRECLVELVDMVYLRSQLTFTQSRVVAGELVPWNSPEVPSALREVVDHCVKAGAYKPFQGKTVGHFAAKIDDQTFLTSIRKSNFNDISKNGLVRIKTDGPDTVLAYGAKPSVGGQSQRIVFMDHPDCDCIVHFHSPIREGSQVPVASQREYECGSHECGRRTSDNLRKFGNLYAVYLDQHGPNIVFNRNINPQEVIDFIEDNFDLSQKTGGPVSLSSSVDA